MLKKAERWPGVPENATHHESAEHYRQFARQQPHTKNIFKEINAEHRRRHTPVSHHQAEQSVVEPPKAKDLEVAALFMGMLVSAGTFTAALYLLISHMR
jgi:hypothetical protein